MKKSLLIPLSLVILLIIGLLVAPLFINTSKLIGNVDAKIASVTGKKLSVNDSSLRLLPWPSMTLTGVDIQYGEEAPMTSLLTAPEIHATLDVVKLLQGDLSIASVEIVQPQLTVLADASFLKKKKAEQNSNATPIWSDPYMSSLSELTIVDGKVMYVDKPEEITNPYWAFDHLHVAMGTSLLTRSFTGEGSTDFRNKNYTLSFALKDVGEKIDAKLALKQAENSFDFSGAVSKGDSWVAEGDVAAQAIDLLPLIEVEAAKPMPAKLQSKLKADFKQAQLSEITAEFAGGKLKAGDMAFQYAPAALRGKLVFDTIDLNVLKDVLTIEIARPVIEEKESDLVVLPTADDQKEKEEEGPKTQLVLPVLPSDLDAAFSITADSVKYKDHVLKNFQNNVQWVDNIWMVTQATAEFPGDSRLTFIGEITQKPDNFSIVGGIEGEGQSLTGLLPVWDIPTTNLSVDGMRRFRLRTNVKVDKDQANFSEFQMQVEQTYMTGAIIALFKNTRRYEIQMRADNLKLDQFLDVARGVVPKKEIQPGIRDINPETWRWLKELPFQMVLTTRLNGFYIGEDQGNTAYFVTRMEANKFSVEDLHGEFKGETVDGNLKLELKPDGVPFLNAALRFSTLPASFLVPVKPIDEVEGEKKLQLPEFAVTAKNRWSQVPLDFSYFSHGDGQFDLSFGKLQFPTFDMSSVRIIASLENNILTVKDWVAGIWQGMVKAAGVVNFQDIPAVNTNFSFQNVEANQVLNAILGIDIFTGRVNLSGNLAGGGLSPYAWIGSAKGSFGVGGSNIRVDGFDVPTVVRRMDTARTVADIVNASRVAFTQGITEFSSLDGAIFVESGNIKTNALKLISDTSTAVVEGEASLPKWEMDIRTKFALGESNVDTKVLKDKTQQAERPVLGVRFVGPMDKPGVEFDTSLLEAYIAKKSTDRLMNAPPQ